MHCTACVHGHLQVDMYMYIHVYNVHVQCTLNSSPITALQKAPCGQWTTLHRVASGPHDVAMDCTCNTFYLEGTEDTGFANA